MNKVVVVGGGIAGLAAAYRLKQEGYDVTVLESKRRLGGRLFTTWWEGFKVELGAHFVTGADQLLLRIVRELGLDNERTPFDPEGLITTILRDGKLHTFNYLSPLSFLRWSGVTAKAKLSALSLLPGFVGKLRAELYHPETALGEDRSVGEAFKDSAAGELLTYWIMPMFSLMCGWNKDDLTTDMFYLLMSKYTNQGTYTFNKGVSVLAEAIGKQIHVEVNSTVMEIVPRGKEAVVRYQRDGEQAELVTTAVIIAVEGTAVRGLLKEHVPSAWAPLLAAVNYASGLPMYAIMDVPRDLTLSPPYVLIPEEEDDVLLGIGGEKGGEEGTRLLLQFALHHPERLLQESQETLFEMAEARIPRYYPQLREFPIRNRLMHRWAHKTPTWRPGYLAALARARPHLAHPPLYLCGDYLAGPSAGAALTSGWECAGQMMGALEAE